MKVAFIGAGGIGGPMAECLAKKDFDLTVCDLREAALEPLRKLGARVTLRIADCAMADFVIVMVATDAQARAVVLGDAGLLADPSSVESIAAQIETMITDDAKRDAFAHKGLERAKMFSWDKAARECLGIYEELLRS